MTRKERYANFISYFSENQPEAETELTYRTPFELLVAVVLSAQCTDKRVNIVSEKLFLDFPTAEVMAVSRFDILFPYIKSISYPSNKTKHLLGLSQMLVNEFNGQVPMNIKELQRMPGVGRKTANVIVSVLDQQPAMAVDTHVYRVSKRLGLVPLNAKTPLAVERQLIRHLPEASVHKAHHWLILHGRYTCVARKPKCTSCSITKFCRHYSLSNKDFK
ncbi:MAG: endonuclease III [Flammeovirgaceae bacterium]|jgi:endonuclease III|nr:endonuclease III [Flammeovirgaceae bacterium]|tara:strand:+ start:84989 stop:85642 length:654 start_codon:yes stop_codon:yes gene_type:complete